VSGMEREGPTLEVLTRRLAETPEDFLLPPRLSGAGKIHVSAVVCDLLQMYGVPFLTTDPEGPLSSEHRTTVTNRLSVILLFCWLLVDPWFATAKLEKDALIRLLSEDYIEPADQTPSRKFVADPDRREELVRFVLARLGFRPQGETIAQAQDRLTSLSAAERARVMSAAKVAEERARTIREALTRKAAAESADKWSRE
jgi:hypothetical protein